jgi:uncharacterized FAD-dependent dehydrogenase
MQKEIEYYIEPDFVNDINQQKKIISGKIGFSAGEINAIRVIKKSIDARSKKPLFRIKAVAFINEEPGELYPVINYLNAREDKKVIIVGSGPAGLFSALKLLEYGIKPVILERGKDVQARRRDLRGIQQENIVNPDSNYCFGEGGAGTYSDGKLYTRSTKKGDVHKIFNVFYQHGAQKEILVDAHPHIGSNVLPKVVQSIRETIISHGGEVHFNSRVTDFLMAPGRIKGVIVNEKTEFLGDSVILAAGHSARDIFYLLDKHKIKMEPKPFAVGVRIEHPQELIDFIQYHSKVRHPNLPAANYSLTCQIEEKGVYSFCMCPGGIIIPASTAESELVLNGMSVSRRDSKYANSGFVVSVNETDWKDYAGSGVFAGLEFQKSIEAKSFEYGSHSQKAPAQRVTDFINNKISQSLPATSYIPGTVAADMNNIFPVKIAESLRKGLIASNNKMRGYVTEEAQVLAAETRTSSPVRVPRNNETLMHVECEGLYPCGEGAGYAGGIVSAAIDGERCAEAIAKQFA